MNLHYQDLCLQIRHILLVANEMIVTFYNRSEELSHEIQLSCDTTGVNTSGKAGAHILHPPPGR
jgi:hypothetical protein